MLFRSHVCCSAVGLSLHSILGGNCHAGADLLLVRGKLDIEDNNAVDPGFNVFDAVEFFLCSTIGKAKCRVEVGNEVGTETSSGDMLQPPVHY